MGITKLFNKNGDMSGISDERIATDLVWLSCACLVPTLCLALVLPLSPTSCQACDPDCKDTGGWVAILAPMASQTMGIAKSECSSNVQRYECVCSRHSNLEDQLWVILTR